MNQFTLPIDRLNRFEEKISCSKIEENEKQEIIQNLNDIIYFFYNDSKDPIEVLKFMSELKPFSNYININK